MDKNSRVFSLSHLQEEQRVGEDVTQVDEYWIEYKSLEASM